MTSSDSQIDKPQRGRPKRAELPDVNINTSAQSINTEITSLNPLSLFESKLNKESFLSRCKRSWTGTLIANINDTTGRRSITSILFVKQQY